MRLIYLILIQFFNVVGFGVATAVILLLLVSNKTINGKRSYLYPLVPFHGKALLSMFVRFRKDRFAGAEKNDES